MTTTTKISSSFRPMVAVLVLVLGLSGVHCSSSDSPADASGAHANDSDSDAGDAFPDEGSGKTMSNDGSRADASSSSSGAGDAASPDGGDTVSGEPPPVACDGPTCSWTDCATGETVSGDFEPLEECSNVEVPDWFELRTCVVDYDSLMPFVDGRQGVGYCACVRGEQVTTATIPIEETAEGCIYTYDEDPCNTVEFTGCPGSETEDAGSGGGTGGNTGPRPECTSDSGCSSRHVCRDGRCVSVQCTTDSHCSNCSRCSSNVCRSCGSGPYGCYC